MFHSSIFPQRYIFYKSGTILKLYRMSNFSKCVYLIIQQWKRVVTQIFFKNSGLVENFVLIFICNEFLVRVKIKYNWKAFWTIKTTNISIPSNSAFRSVSYAIENIHQFSLLLGKAFKQLTDCRSPRLWFVYTASAPRRTARRAGTDRMWMETSLACHALSHGLSWISWVVFTKESKLNFCLSGSF